MAPIHIKPPLLIAAGTIWPPVCATIVVMRFIARRGQRAQLGIDDWLVLPALVLLIGMSAAILRGATLKSVGYPNPTSKNADLAFVTSTYEHKITSQVLWAVELMLVLALGSVKLSFMFFYRRVFRIGDSKSFDRVMFSVVAIIIVWTASFFFSLMFECGTHFNYIWAKFENRCVEGVKLQVGFAVSDFITDFIILGFPLPFIWKLQMSTYRRLGVSSVFLLGFFAVASSIARMVVYAKAKAARSPGNPHVAVDEELYAIAAIYIMITEAGFALCAANLSILYGMFRTNGLQKLKESVYSLLSLHRASQGHSTSSHRYRERLGSQDSTPRLPMNAERLNRDKVNVELLPVRTDGGTRTCRDAHGPNDTV